MQPRRKKRQREGRRRGGDAFMDTVRDAFVRWVALEKWREVEDLRTTVGLELAQAIAEAASFPNRGRYQQRWATRWKEELRPEIIGADAGSIFAAIERVVSAAVDDEEAERKANGDTALEEDHEYKRFVDTALERLLREGDLGVR